MQVVRRYIEQGWNNADHAAVEDTLQQPDIDVATIKEDIDSWHSALSYFRLEILDIWADESRVMVHRIRRGNHTGMFVHRALGWGPWPATGKAIEVQDFVAYELNGGKIVSLRMVANWLPLLESMSPGFRIQ